MEPHDGSLFALLHLLCRLNLNPNRTELDGVQYDADCELFDKIISGDLCEEVYYDQVPRAPELNLQLGAGDGS